MVYAWTDAAGASRWLAAVVFARGYWHWTRVLLPQEVWDSLLCRQDDQISAQELLAVPLAYASFPDLLRGCLLLLFVNNQGVLGSMLRGSAGAPDLNAAVGQVWLDIASAGIGLHVARVESRANVADGPTRDDFSVLTRLGAVFREPCLPEWVHDLWAFPEPERLGIGT